VSDVGGLGVGRSRSVATPKLVTSLSRERHPARLVVTGEISLSTAAEFRAALEQASAECGRLVVDLTAAEFLSSAGISSLYRQADHLVAVVVTADSIISRALSVAGFKVLVTDRPEALGNAVGAASGPRFLNPTGRAGPRS
jgi:anti-sigma B factor antagonist